MRAGWTIRAAACASLLALPGCAAKRPVLYPNAAYQQAGPEEARRHVDECIAFAHEQGHAAEPSTRAGGEAAEGATVGAATGAAVGAVLGAAGRGAAAGAAGGGAQGLVRGLFRARDPDPIERGFVQECLRERGYRVVGWK